MRGGEVESGAETDERNVGTLKTDDHLEDSQPHLFIHRCDAMTADTFTIKSINRAYNLVCVFYQRV